MRIVLGNRDAYAGRNLPKTDDKGKVVLDDDGLPVMETRRVPLKGKQATVIDPDDEDTLADVLKNVVDRKGAWMQHAGPDDEFATPAWVASDSPSMALILAEHFGGIEIRELSDPYDPDPANQGKALTSKSGKGKPGISGLLGTMLAIVFMVAALQRVFLLLKVNTGNDFQAAQMGGSASATAVAKFVGVTANVTAPAAGDTTLTAEITTAGGGLIRKAGTYAHTTSAASYTITTTFTANGSDALPVTIGKRGIFDAVTAGNLVFETLVSPTATLSASGDALTLTDTISL